MKKFLITAVVLMSLGFATTALANPVNITPIAYLNLGYGQGGMRAVVSGSHAFVADYYFQVYDLSNPYAPTRVATLPGVGGKDIVGFGRYMFVGGPLDLNVVDVIDPAAPVLVNTLAGLGGNRMAISANYLFVAAPNQLKVLDFSMATEPVQVATLALPGNPADIAISGKSAYVTVGNSLLVVDISNPTAPASVSSLAFANTAYGVAVAGSYAYVTTHGYWCDEEYCGPVQGHLNVVNVSNPLCPQTVSVTATIKAPEDLVLSGQYAYIVEKTVDYYGGHWGVTFVDIANPAAPQVAAKYQSNILNSSAQGLALMDNYIFQPISTGALVFEAYGQPPVQSCGQ